LTFGGFLTQANAAADVIVVILIARLFIFICENGRISLPFEIFGLEELGTGHAVRSGRADEHLVLIFEVVHGGAGSYVGLSPAILTNGPTDLTIWELFVSK
jgi:hypothetical protein